MVRVIVSTTEPPLFINLSWWGFSRFNPNFMHCGLALYPIIGFLCLYCRMMEKSWCPNLRLLGMQWVTVLSCSTVEKHKYHSAAVYHVLEINQTNTSWLYQLIRSLAIQRWHRCKIFVFFSPLVPSGWEKNKLVLLTSFCSVVGVCLLFNFWMIEFTIMSKKT